MKYNYSPDEEDALRFCYLWTQDLQAARNLLRTIKDKTTTDAGDSGVRNGLLQTLVVTYIRPFSNGRGRKLDPAEADSYKHRRARDGDDYYLTHKIRMEDYVPQSLWDLHFRLSAFRGQQFAHT